MNFISAENISKNFAEKWLFQNLNIGINEGDRVALIGVNGSGKSSLLKVLAGFDMADGGTVSLRKGAKVGFLGQNPVFDEAKTVFDNVFFSTNSLLTLIKKYEAHLALPDSTPHYHQVLYELTEQMNQANAWHYEQQIKEIISKLGIGEYIQRPVSVLSGGQRKRVAMAKVLIDEPDVLILDEPTNHLDLETIEWLENLLLSRFKTVLLVTHDRYFLDNVCNQIWELDHGQLYKYKGNYSYFLEKKAEREEVKNAEIDKARNLMRKELDWIRRQPKARGTKAKYRVEAFEVTKAKATAAKADDKLDLQLKMTRQGGKVLEVKKIAKAWGEVQVLKDFSYTFKKGEKIGIIGKNGTGKTTFLNLLTGQIKPDKGDWNVGETTVFGYFKQEDENLPLDKRIIEVVKEIAEYIELADGQKVSASQFLKLFLFPPEVQYNYVNKLSGGERKRLQLLLTLVKNPNFLILDEPTNDLDIGTLNILEDFLAEFQGTLIIVSHDRYFMDRLVDHLFIFEGNGSVSDFPGNYTDYREEVVENQPKIIPTEKHTNPKPEQLSVVASASEKRKLSFKEKTEYETLEKQIAQLEAEKHELVAAMNTGISHELLHKHAQRVEAIEAELSEKELRWLELAERV